MKMKAQWQSFYEETKRKVSAEEGRRKGRRINTHKIDCKEHTKWIEDNSWKRQTLKPVSYTHLDVYKRQGISYDNDDDGELRIFVRGLGWLDQQIAGPWRQVKSNKPSWLRELK